MASDTTLLDLFDTLILNSLRDNVFSDQQQYLDSVANGKNSPLENSKTPREGDLRARGPSAFEKGNVYDDREWKIDFEGGGTYAPIAAASPLGNVVDVFAIGNWLRNISTEFGLFPGKDPSSRGQRLAKFATHVGVSLLEGAFNPGDFEVGGKLNQAVNPLSFVLASVPFARATAVPSPNLAAATSVFGEVYTSAFAISVASGTERLILMRNGLYQKATNLSDISKLDFPSPGFIGDITMQGTPDTLQKPGVGGTPIAVQVDGISSALLKSSVHTNLYSSEAPYSEKNAIAPLDKLEDKADKAKLAGLPPPNKLDLLFVKKTFPGGDPVLGGKTAMTYVARTPPQDSVGVSTVSSATPADVSVRTHISEDPNTGLVPPDREIADSEMYLPFCFQDLRAGIDEFLYFRAFLKGAVSETFTPEWQSERFYGRVDMVPIYTGTTRNISLSFDVVAWSPEDLPLMYKKLHKLQSMVYPAYDTKGFMQAAPLVRMRVGDLIVAQAKKGVPGYITSLDFSYDDGIWNMKTDFKVPRKVTVTLGFNVVHEGNPGVYLNKANLSAPSGQATIENVPAFGTALPLENIGGAPDTFGGLESGVRGVISNIANIGPIPGGGGGKG